MSAPRFIVLNGFAGAGKSTIAKHYSAEHPLTFVIEGDELIVNLGQWLSNESRARVLVYEMIKSLARAHLSEGYDVVLPYLVTDAAHIAEFEQIAAKQNAQFFNFFLSNQKDVAIARLLERGTWGEAGTDPLSEKDLPEIHRLYDQMEAQLESQKDVVVLQQDGQKAEDTYATVISTLAASKG